MSTFAFIFVFVCVPLRFLVVGTLAMEIALC